MNYKKIYDNLILKSKNRSKQYEEYVIKNHIRCNNPGTQARYIKNKMKSVYRNLEVHHILPKSDGGIDALDNFSFLTCEEHIIAHHLLYKAEPSKNHFLAWHYLTMSDHTGKYKKRLTPKEYQELIDKNREIASNRKISDITREKLIKANTGENNGMYGKKWYTDGKTNIVCIPGTEPNGFKRRKIKCYT